MMGMMGTALMATLIYAAVMMMVVLCAQQQTFGDGGKSGKVHFLSPFAGIQWRGVQS